MTCHSIQSKNEIFVKDYEFLSFAEKMIKI